MTFRTFSLIVYPLSGIIFSIFSQNSFAEELLVQQAQKNTAAAKGVYTVNAQTELTLETAMNMAEDYSFSAKIAQQDQILSESQENAAFRGMLPNVTATGSYTINDDSVNKLVGSSIGAQFGIPSDTVATGALTLTQPLVGLLPMYFAVQQASAQTRAAIQNKNLSKMEARFNGAQAFINAQKASQLLKAAESSIEVSQKQLRDAEAQFNAGKLTNADLLKFKLNLENSKTSLIQAQTTYKIALLTLAEAIGIKDLRNILLPSGEKSVWESKANKIPELSTVLAPGLGQRQDLLAAKETLNATKYAKMQTTSSYLPTLNFVATYSRNFLAKDINYAGQTYNKEDYQDNFSYGLQLSWVLLDWGVRQAQISGTVASEQKAKYALENLSSKARIDITNNYYQLKDAIQVLDSAKVSVQYAQDAYSQMKARFDNGQVTATDLISSSNDQTTARANLANAKGALDLAWISYQKSLGSKLTTLN